MTKVRIMVSLIFTILFIGGVVIITSPKQNEELKGQQAVVTYDSLNVRDEADQIIGQVHKGRNFTLTGKERFDLNYSWYEVYYEYDESKTAWVCEVGIRFE